MRKCKNVIFHNFSNIITNSNTSIMLWNFSAWNSSTIDSTSFHFFKDVQLILLYLSCYRLVAYTVTSLSISSEAMIKKVKMIWTKIFPGHRCLIYNKVKDAYIAIFLLWVECTIWCDILVVQYNVYKIMVWHPNHRIRKI